MKASIRWRTAATVLTLVGALVFVGAAASSEGVTPQQLQAHGWTCFVPPPFPAKIVCFNPGLGRPFAGNPDPRPAYSFVAFDRASGTHIENGHLIRQDLYSGQPCSSSGAPYRYVAAIGYYECVHAPQG